MVRNKIRSRSAAVDERGIRQSNLLPSNAQGQCLDESSHHRFRGRDLDGGAIRFEFSCPRDTSYYVTKYHEHAAQ
jgi:hypothetical protein